jgi:hypothetical protein
MERFVEIKMVGFGVVITVRFVFMLDLILASRNLKLNVTKALICSGDIWPPNMISAILRCQVSSNAEEEVVTIFNYTGEEAFRNLEPHLQVV